MAESICNRFSSPGEIFTGVRAGKPMLQKSRNMQLPARVGYGERYRLRRLTGGPMRGCLLSHAISSVSSTPGVASGVTRRSGKPWFFANRFIESSLSPKSLVIIRNCNHRSVQVVIRIFHPSYVYTRCSQAGWDHLKRTRSGH